MEKWSAFPLKELNFELFMEEQQMNEAELKAWNTFKIKPELWLCDDVFESYFWVVAHTENQAIFYNDILENFSIAPFRQKGQFIAYKATNQTLIECLNSI